MPAESIVTPQPAVLPSPLGIGAIKCSHCGGSGLPSSSSRGGEEVVILDEEIERICAACWRAEQAARSALPSPENVEVGEVGEVGETEDGISGIGLGLRGMTVGTVSRLPAEEDFTAGLLRTPSPPSDYAHPVEIDSSPPVVVPQRPSLQPHSLPSQQTQPWTTHIRAGGVWPIREEGTTTRPGSTSPVPRADPNRPSNPLLDVTKARVSSAGRGALYPGSVFKGSQTSGRSAYDVEVRFIDVNLPESTVSGYLSISHLTDTHPHLTTFFTGEIIGSKYGFITGSRYGATEHDDMRHWGRFEQFRRPSTRADMLRPELLLRDPLPDRRRAGMGETKGLERDFVFLRIKERFLVPDHTVRDISGASFAGFYFAMIDLNPSSANTDIPPTPTSPSAPKSPTLPTSPGLPGGNQYFPLVSPSAQRRQSTGPPPVAPAVAAARPAAPRRMSSSGPRSPSVDVVSGVGAGPGPRRRRESSGAGVMGKVPEREAPREATIRGYYFHSLNQEPFQELFLTHVPNRSSSTFEMR